MAKLFRFDVIRDGNSRKLIAGQLLSQICDKVMSLGLVWVISDQFSAKWIPWFIGVSTLPHLLLAPYSGRFVAKMGALRTVILTDFFRGVLFLVAAALVHHEVAGETRLQASVLSILFVVSFVSSIAGSLFNPAILTLPVKLAPTGALQELTAMVDSCFSLGNVLGPLVSVVVYQWVGLPGLLAVNGASYIYAGVLGLGIKVPAARSAVVGEEGSPPARFVDVIGRQSVIRGMLVSFLLMNLVLAPVMVFLPYYAKNVFGGDISALATLEFFMGVGSVLGSVWLSFGRAPGRLGVKIPISLVLMAGSYLGFTLANQLILGCLFIGFLGLFLSLANIFILNFFQTCPEEKDVPVVMGLVNLISVASLPISMGLIGLFIESIRVEIFATSCAAILLILSAGTRAIPGIREI